MMDPRDLPGPAEIARSEVQLLRDIAGRLCGEFGEMSDADYHSCYSRASDILAKYLALNDKSLEQFEQVTHVFRSNNWDYDPLNPPLEHEIEWRRQMDNYRVMRARLPGLRACIMSIEKLMRHMPEAPLSVRERREGRDLFLRALRQLANSEIGRHTAFQRIVEHSGLDPYRGRQAADDLVASNHIEKDSNFAFALTRSGRDYAEELEAPTPRQAMSVNQFFSPVGVFQQGDHNTATVSQQVNHGPQDYITCLDLLRKAAQALPEKQRACLLDQEENLREELEKPEPRWSRVAAFFATAARIVESVKPVAPLVFETFQKLGRLLGPHIERLLSP